MYYERKGLKDGVYAPINVKASPSSEGKLASRFDPFLEISRRCI